MNIESKTAVRLGITGLIVYAGYFAIDQGAKPVYGNGPVSPTSTVGFSPTPEKYTPTTVRTSTVRVLLTPSLTPTRGGRATETLPPTGTITAMPTRTLQELQKELEKIKSNLEEKSKREELQKEIDKALGTPTKSPSPTSTSTPTFSPTPTASPTKDPNVLIIPIDVHNKTLNDDVNRSLTAVAGKSTPQIVYITPVVPVGSGNRGEGSSPWQCITGIIAGGIGAGVAGYIMRRRIMDFIRQRLAPQQPAAPAGGAPLEDDLAEE